MPIQSITVAAPSPIYIPRNARILGFSYTGDASSDVEEVDCVNTDSVEEVECFGFAIPTNDAVTEQVWAEPSQATIASITIQGTAYPFTSQLNDFTEGTFDTSEFIAALQTVPLLNGVAVNWTGCVDFSDQHANYTFIVFRTIPSIAINTYLKMTVGFPSSTKKVIENIPLLSITELNELFGAEIPCPCVEPV